MALNLLSGALDRRPEARTIASYCCRALPQDTIWRERYSTVLDQLVIEISKRKRSRRALLTSIGTVSDRNS